MKTIELNDANPHIADLIKDAAGQDMLITRNGKPLAHLERIDDLEVAALQYENSSQAIADGQKGRQQYASGEVVSLKQVRRKILLKASPKARKRSQPKR